MAKTQTAVSGVKSITHVARDPHPVSARIQRAVARRAKAATVQTARIKAKRQAG